MRVSFTSDFYRTSRGESLLPDDVLWRTKEAFSDGVSCKTRSLYEIIQDHCNKQFLKDHVMDIIDSFQNPQVFSTVAEKDPYMSHLHGHLIPQTAEQYYYRKEFEKNYKGMGHVVPYFWMPKYADFISDPSARTLQIYKENIIEEADQEESQSL